MATLSLLNQITIYIVINYLNFHKIINLMIRSFYLFVKILKILKFKI